MRDTSRIAEAFPRHRASGRAVLPAREQVEWARWVWEQHVPSMVTYICLTCGMVRWPCRPYREADALLRGLGLIDLDGRLRALNRPTWWRGGQPTG